MERARYNLQYLSRDQREKEVHLSSRDYRCDASLTVPCYEDAFVLPSNDCGGGGVVTKDGDYLESTYLHKGIGTDYKFQDFLEDDRAVVYIGMFHDCWGHCLTDDLQHLWFLFRSDLKWLQSNVFVFTTVFRNFNPPPQFIKLLECLGVEWSDLKRVTTVTRFNKVYVPDDSILIEEETGLRFYTEEFKQVIDAVVSSICGSFQVFPGQKVYFSRAAFPSKKDFGEKYVERAFHKSGYQIVHPEALSLEEQVAILKNADVLATTEGSISMNAVFMKEHSSLVLVRKGTITSYQHMINDLRSLQVTVIDAHKSSQISKTNPWNGPFFLYCTKSLAAFLGIRKPPFPLFAYLKYVFRFKYIPLFRKIKKQVKGKAKRILCFFLAK